MGTKEFVLALAIVGAVAWTAKADGPAPVRDLVVKGKLTVGAEDGKGGVEIGTLDGKAYVHLKDAAGVRRARIELLGDGMVSVNLGDAAGAQRIGAVVLPGGECAVTATSPDGKSVAEMRASARSVWFTAADAEERLRAVLGVSKGKELLHLADPDGTPTADLGSR